VASDPESPEARDLLGRAYGLTARSAHLLEQMHLARKARACFARAVELDPRYVPALADLARYDMQAPGVLGGGKKKARETIASVLALDPVLGHILLGELAEIEKDPARAEAEYRSAVAADPSSPRGRLALSDFFVARRDYGKARRVWAEMLELDATSPWPAYALAGVALASGEGLGPAAGDLETLLGHEAWSGDPTPAQCRARLADVNERLGKTHEAK
jgi:tetratricopeptide (TPR) repeat protein